MKKQQEHTRGIGYFETLFSTVSISTMAETLKQFSLEQKVNEKSEEEEVLNGFISTLIKNIDIEEFQEISSQLFSYPKDFENTVEVDQIEPSKAKLTYLKENIDYLLKNENEVV